MRTIRLSISTGKDIGTIDLGIRGENEVTQVVLDYTMWSKEFEKNGDTGTIGLLVKRKGDKNAYPVVLDIDIGNSLATWVVSSTDTAYVGGGSAEYEFFVNGKVAKSIVFRTSVQKDIGNASVDPPEPYSDWVDTLTELGAQANADADAAIAAAERAEAAVQSAVSEVFNATYNVTTYAEIRAAVDAGKTVICKKTDDSTTYYARLQMDREANGFVFRAITADNSQHVTFKDFYCFSNAWIESSPDLYPLGNPVVKASGQFLKYNGTNWVAADLPEEVIWTTYGETVDQTLKDRIRHAYFNNIIVMCKVPTYSQTGDLLLRLADCDYSTNSYTFTGIHYEQGAFSVVCAEISNDTWSVNVKTV